ncbi:MAG: DUF6527 family protein [Hyphomicrobiales bacterium]
MNIPLVLNTEFVAGIPDNLEERTLYISMEYATIVHNCCCGCGLEVITPLSPTDWQLTYDGVSVSLRPSIGNWSFPCRSHYWIDKSEVRWAGQMTQELIDAGRAHDRRAKARYLEAAKQMAKSDRPIIPTTPKGRIWSWLSRLWS